MAVEGGAEPTAVSPSAMDDYLFDLKGFLVVRNALSAAEVRAERTSRSSLITKNASDHHFPRDISLWRSMNAPFVVCTVGLYLPLLQVAEMNAMVDSHLDLQPGMANTPSKKWYMGLC
eukprot:COSAG02_NODE_5623_length_4175_cov_3.200442_1_plen_118_part_00